MTERYQRTEKKSSSDISGQISQKATLAASMQAITDVRPGNITRYHNYNNFKIENYLNLSVNLNQPIIDLATRGVMVERAYIEMDEVDMGWILAEAIKKNNHYQIGYHHFVGMLLSFAPIATAAAFMISEDENKFSLNELKNYTSEFLINSTPEDADSLFSALYNLNIPKYAYINDFAETDIEGSNYMLEEEINLPDFYKLFEKESLVFSELSNKYQFCFTKGYEAFKEAIDLKSSFTDAITHSFITVLAHHPPKIDNNEDPYFAYKIKQEAMELIDMGGYLTSKGKIMISKFDNTILNYENKIELAEIGQLTSIISFIALLNGDGTFH